MSKRVIYYFVFILIGGMIFGTNALASAIDVHFLPLKYFINGQEITPLPGQQGFIFNGRVYVPLRFLAETMGCEVVWEKASSTVRLAISPDDIPALPEKTVAQEVYFTGTWETDSGSIYRLKQNGDLVTGAFIHYADKSKYEFPLSGKVFGDRVELTWSYDDAEAYRDIKSVPLEVAEQVEGITETNELKFNPESKALEGFYFQDYIVWNNNSLRVTQKYDGYSSTAKSKVPPVEVKLEFVNPI